MATNYKHSDSFKFPNMILIKSSQNDNSVPIASKKFLLTIISSYDNKMFTIREQNEREPSIKKHKKG